MFTYELFNLVYFLCEESFIKLMIPIQENTLPNDQVSIILKSGRLVLCLWSSHRSSYRYNFYTH